LLGSVEVRIEGQPVEVGSARQQCVLVSLLADVNSCVSIESLIERVWGGSRLPHRPRAAVQTYVSLLRRVLATSGVNIVRRGGGYMLTAPEQTIDLHWFRWLVKAARASDDTRAEDLLEQALAQWHGEPFAALDTLWLNTLRATLGTERRAAQLDLTDLQLRRGRHATLLASLSEMVEQHPLDERLAGQYLIALSRAGRPADALDHYQRLRRRLVDELGTDPGPALRRLHHQILTGEAAGALPAGSGPPSRAVPRQLPRAPAPFAGRVSELARLDDAVHAPESAGTVMLSTIGGMGGIGKTWLGLHWAHRNLSRFPDGQLFVNLRGFDPAGPPMPVDTAVQGFLLALGVDPAAMPFDLDTRTALYRSLVAGKHMLVMLDNARDTAQVTPLLPGSGSCTVLVTSRRRLTGLIATGGAVQVDLETLTETEARELLARRLGADRVAAEPEAVAELLRCCAGLPLALSIVAARAITSPRLPLAKLAVELRDVSTRLDALDTGDLTVSIRAALSWSYAELPPPAADMLGLLALAPGPDIGLPAVESLCALPAAQARTALRALEDASLVQEHKPGRYRMHDLIRLYAADKAVAEQPDGLRDGALRRLVSYYLHTAHGADRLLSAHRERIQLGSPEADHATRLPDAEAAVVWFGAEHACLLASQQLAADRGWHDEAWQLAWVRSTFNRRQGRQQDHLDTWRVGLTAAERLGQPGPVALAHRSLGQAYALAGKHIAALHHLHHALSLAQRTADRASQAHTLRTLAWAWEKHGDHRWALRHATRARHLFRALDLTSWEAVALNQMGWSQAHLGQYRQARVHCGQALILNSRHNDREGQAITLDSLAYIALRQRQYPQALNYAQRSLALFHAIGHTYYEAETLERLAEAHLALGDHRQAAHAWHQALELFQNQHRAGDADRIRQRLATLASEQSSPA
jgi:DNA-binding SARP family transcriptional activator